MQNNFIGIILAAGRGSRMLNETKSKPKCMTKFSKKSTLLDKQINSLKLSGIKKIYIVTGYKQNQIKNKDVIKIFNKEWKTSNMVFSLLKAKKLLLSRNCIISYSDILYENKVIVKMINNFKKNFLISYDSRWKKLWGRRFTDPLSDAESFKIDKQNNIVNIGNKEKDIKKIQGQFMGLIKTNPSDWKKIFRYLKKIDSKKIQKLQSTQLLNDLIKNKIIKIKGIKNVGKWCEVDNQSDLKIAKQIFNK